MIWWKSCLAASIATKKIACVSCNLHTFYKAYNFNVKWNPKCAHERERRGCPRSRMIMKMKRKKKREKVRIKWKLCRSTIRTESKTSAERKPYNIFFFSLFYFFAYSLNAGRIIWMNELIILVYLFIPRKSFFLIMSPNCMMLTLLWFFNVVIIIIFDVILSKAMRLLCGHEREVKGKLHKSCLTYSKSYYGYELFPFFLENTSSSINTRSWGISLSHTTQLPLIDLTQMYAPFNLKYVNWLSRGAIQYHIYKYSFIQEAI